MTANQSPDKLIQYLIDKIKEINLTYSLSAGLTDQQLRYLKESLQEIKDIEQLVSVNDITRRNEGV